MNGNTPYAGQPGSTDAGQRTDADEPQLSPEEHRALKTGVSAVAARTREFLPDEYAVGTRIAAGANGPQATVAVRPPVGNAVSAGFEPDDELEEGLSSEDRDEVAGGLAASAALQVKQAFGENVPQIAR